MYIKNTLRLFINNLGIGMKAVFYRLVVTFIGLLCLYAVLYIGTSEIFQSAQMRQVFGDLKSLWLQFLGVNSTTATVNIQASVKALSLLIKANFSRIVWSGLFGVVILFAMDFALGLCNFTLTVMIDKHMSTISNSHFTQTFIQSLKKAVLFELFYTTIKFVFALIVGIILIAIILLLGQAISMLSVVFGLWFVIFVCSFFLSFTARLRPRVAQGEKLSVALHNNGFKKGEFFSVFTAYIFSIVLVAYVNISMLITTLGSGLMLSIPMSYLYLMCLQNIIEYTLSGKKYYLDYQNIVVPKQLRSEEERLLSDVEIN